MVLKDFAHAAQRVCARHSAELKGEHWLPWQCLDFCYIYSLLHDGYRLRDERELYVRLHTNKRKHKQRISASEKAAREHGNIVGVGCGLSLAQYLSRRATTTCSFDVLVVTQ